MNSFAVRRKQAGLTQWDVAHALGKDQSTVAKWETGKALPKARMLGKLSHLYHCTIDELFYSPLEEPHTD